MRLSPLLFAFVLLLLAPFALCADAVMSQPAATPVWLQGVFGIMSLLVTMFLVPYLHEHAKQARAAADLSAINANGSLIDQRATLMNHLKAYVFEQAGAMAEKYWPQLAGDIAAGKFSTPESIKAELKTWGQELRDNAVKYFAVQGIDLVQTFGVQALDDLIAAAANATSPFPGKETAVAVLQKDVAPLLVANGIAWMQRHSMTTDATGFQLPAAGGGLPVASSP